MAKTYRTPIVVAVGLIACLCVGGCRSDKTEESQNNEAQKNGSERAMDDDNAGKERANPASGAQNPGTEQKKTGSIDSAESARLTAELEEKTKQISDLVSQLGAAKNADDRIAVQQKLTEARTQQKAIQSALDGNTAGKSDENGAAKTPADGHTTP